MGAKMTLAYAKTVMEYVEFFLCLPFDLSRLFITDTLMTSSIYVHMA